MIRFTWILLVVVAFLLGVSGRAVTAAATELDKETFERLSDQVNDQKRARVVAKSNRMEIYDPIIHSWGVEFSRPYSDSERDSLLWDDVDKLQVTKGSAKTGALVGASILGAAGLVAGIAASDPCSGGFDLSPCWVETGGVLALTGVGLALGALLGSGVGSLIDSWKTVYEGDDPSGKLSMSIIAIREGEVGLVLRMTPG